jgi:hypothetical protein
MNSIMVKEKINKMKEEADLNKDGKVSLQEGLDYAAHKAKVGVAKGKIIAKKAYGEVKEDAAEVAEKAKELYADAKEEVKEAADKAKEKVADLKKKRGCKSKKA